jgi:tRNA pseudouridine38-40 synthase
MSIMRFKAVIQYDGTNYKGFQVQPGCPTVQGALHRSLGRLMGVPVKVIGAGRTDAGVHALGQVIHFDLAQRWEPQTLRRALDALLPQDVGVRRVEEVPEEFHARFSAVSREYRYAVYNSQTRNPLVERHAYRHKRPLDDRLMDQVCQLLRGTHDFSFLGKDPGGRASSIRHVYRAGCLRRGSWVLVEVVASAFLRHMMRILTGVLLKVGDGTWTPDRVEEILSGRWEGQARPSAPARGLTLVGVNYGWGRPFTTRRGFIGENV